VPLGAVLGIYARETGQGMIFSENDMGPEPPAAGKSSAAGEKGRRPHLKVVK
jgi:stringent starvation protein B